MNKLNFIITGATAAMLLMPVTTDAQKLERTVRGSVPASVLQTPRKVTSKQLAKEEAMVRENHPLMFRGKVFESPNQKSGLKVAETGKRRISPLAVTPRVPMRAAANAAQTGRELWANVINDNTWTEDDYTYGFYKFNAVDNITVDLLGQTGYTANGGGAIVGDRLYLVYYYSFWGWVFPYMVTYDTETWEQVSSVSLDDYTLIGMETATAASGDVYGEFYNADGSSYELGVVDYANQTRTTIGTLTKAYLAMGITKENVLYGIATDGKLYKIDIETAAETEVGSTGLTLLDSDNQYYYQSGEIDAKTNTFYWATADPTTQLASLYTVDLASGAAAKVGDFVNQNLMTLLTVPTSVADGAPAAVTDLAANFNGGELSGTVTFKAPTLNAIGEALTGEITYNVLSGKDTLATGTAAAGADVSVPVTFATDGTKNITVIASNAEGDGLKAKTSLYVGYDTPKEVTGVVCNLDNETGKVTVTWDAVTEGEHGAYLGDITYDVVRYPDEVKVASGIADTIYTETLPKADLKSYTYGVTATNGHMTGDEGMSGAALYGDPITPPYSQDFNDENGLDLYTIIDSNNDGKTWGWYGSSSSEYSPSAKYAYSAQNAGDDWLITPPLKLEKGKFYTVSFKARANGSYYPERIEAKFGKGNTAADMTEELVPPTDLKSATFVEFKKEVTVSEDGTYYIGFHAISDADEYALYVDDVLVEGGKFVQAPDSVTNFTAVPGAKGAKSATVSFNAPAKAIDGSSLSAMTVSVKRGNNVIKTFNNVSAGDALTYTDNDAAEGFNTYSVIASIAEYGNGRESVSKKIYVGVDAPDAPSNLKMTDNSTSVNISWDASETGVNGGYVDPQTVKHNIYSIVEGTWSIDYELMDSTAVGATTYDLAYNTNEGDQQFIYYGVSSVNDKGESEIGVTPSLIVGKPYSIPFFESTPGGTFNYDFWWLAKNGGSSTYSTSDESSDGDGGSFAYTSAADEDHAMLGSGKISLAGATNPMLIFSHKAETTSGATIKVYAQKPDGTRDLLKTISNNTGDWVRESISLNSEYASLKYIEVVFETSAATNETVNYDEIYVRDIYDNDVTLSDITAPSIIKKGETANVSVKVTNFGSKAAKGYTVKLYAGDELVASTAETESLEPFASKTYKFDYKSSVLNTESSVNLKAEVEYANDLNPDDNAKSTSLSFKVSNKPRPESVTAQETGSGEVTVNWSAVNASAVSITDGFEDYTSWAMDDFGEWTSVTGHVGATTGSLFESYPYPSQGYNFAFTVVDPLNNWISESMLEANSSLKPHGGSKYLASFYAYTDDEFLDADNWLISPSLSGGKQTVKFWVSNNNTSTTTYEETFDVLYSTEGTDTAKFVKIGDTHTASAGTWEEVSVEIPEGATHFAIHQNTISDVNFVFQIDDVTYEAGSGEVTGYNVYRDGELIKSISSAETTSFVDNTVEGNKTYVYAVTAVFADGESEATIASAIVTDIQNVEAAIKASSYNVYTIDGKLVGTGMKSLSGLKSGSYIINDQKVVIR